jgi:hypothetical protein
MLKLVPEHAPAIPGWLSLLPGFTETWEYKMLRRFKAKRLVEPLMKTILPAVSLTSAKTSYHWNIRGG